MILLEDFLKLHELSIERYGGLRVSVSLAY